MGEESFFNQNQQGFPDRPATDLEFCGNSDFAEILSGLKMTLPKGGPNRVGHHVAN